MEPTHAYTADLLALASTSKRGQRPPALEGASRINMPLVWTEWSRVLRDHPDSQLRDYLLSCIREGFRVGFEPHQPLKSDTMQEHAVALDNPEPVTEYLHL